MVQAGVYILPPPPEGPYRRIMTRHVDVLDITRVLGNIREK